MTPAGGTIDAEGAKIAENNVLRWLRQLKMEGSVHYVFGAGKPCVHKRLRSDASVVRLSYIRITATLLL